MKRQGVTESPAGKWTRPEDYLRALARKRGYRHARDSRGRTEPESPRLLLSTLPFMALFALLGVLAAAIIVAAFPGSQPRHYALQAAKKEQGVASPGWFQEAKRDFHR